MRSRGLSEINEIANGKELVKNGTNLVTTDGWSEYSGTEASVDSGLLSFVSTVGNALVGQPINLVVGSTYEVNVTIGEGTPSLYIQTGFGSGNIASIPPKALSLGNNTYIFVATHSTLWIEINSLGTNETITAGNISVKEIPKVQGENLPDYVATRSNYGFKNYIINGGFDVWQRGTSFSNNVIYTADRWWVETSIVAPLVNKTVDGLTLEKTSTASYFILKQPIESNKNLSGKTVTFSVKIKSISGGAKAQIGIRGIAGKDNSTGLNSATLKADNTVDLSTSFDTYSVTATIPTYVGDNYTVGVIVDIRDTNTGSTTDKIEIADAQLEEGSVATPFEQRPYGLELSLCQRYLPYRSYLNNYTNHGSGFCSSTTQATIEIPTHTTARTIPTTLTWSGNIIIVRGTGTTIPVTNIEPAISTTQSPDRIRVVVTVASGLVAGEHVKMQNNADTTAYIEIPTEL